MAGLDFSFPVALVTTLGSLLGTKMTNKSNEAINKSQMQFSREEAEKQRQWQSDEWTRQYNIQRDEWYNQLEEYQNAQWKQYLKEAEYNSPSAQVRRLAQAGLNPSAVLGGQGSSGLVSAATGNISSVGSPSPPSGGPVSGAVASTPSQIPMQTPSIFNNIGSLFRDLTSASKDSKMLEPLVKLMSEQILGIQQDNILKKIDVEIMSKVKDVKVKQAWSDYYNSYADYMVKSSLYENYSADTMLKNAERFLAEAKKKLSDEEYRQLQFVVAHQAETWNTEQDLKKGQTRAAYGSAAALFASAKYSGALTKTEDEIRQFKVNNEKFLNKFNEYHGLLEQYKFDVLDANKQAQIRLDCERLSQEFEREGLLTKEAAARASQAAKEDDWWLYRNIIGPVAEHISDKQDKNADRLVKFLDILPLK